MIAISKLSALSALSAFALLLMAAPAAAVPTLDFSIGAPATGSIAYVIGGGGSGKLVGTNIAVGSVVGGLGTPDTASPLNNGVLAGCTGCLLNFTTGNATGSGSNQWNFGAGGTITLTGAVPSAGATPTLFTGTWEGASVTYFGGEFKIAGGIFSSSVNDNVAAYFGLPGGSGWNGALNLSFLASGYPGTPFSSSALGSGDIMVSTNRPPIATPEPASLLLIGTGVAATFTALGLRGRKRSEGAPTV
jgi:PEP-CTERM motif-containing protein